MSVLPCELVDHIIDLLRDSQTTLSNCCLVSKSWVPRTRTHLFAGVKFRTPENLQSWKTTFPDPSTSPACYTKSLLIGCPEVVKITDVKASGWIGGFSQVVHLALGPDRFTYEWEIAFFLFRGFSPFLKSLLLDHIVSRPSKLFDFILSFPLLEDLSLVNCCCLPDNGGGHDELPTAIQPSSPPIFTGTLNLLLMKETEPIIQRLLSLPGGVHFRKLDLEWHYDNSTPLIMALVGKCFQSIESLVIACRGSCGTCII